MAKTYTIIPDFYGGRGTKQDSTFANLSSFNSPRIGGDGGSYLLGTSFFLKEGTTSDGLIRTPAEFKALSDEGGISSITLVTTHNSTKTTKNADVRYGPKKTSSTTDWEISSGTTIPEGLVKGAATNTFVITDAGVPDTYSYTVGGVALNYYSIVSGATITIVTEETDFKLIYDANGGENAPASVTNIDYQSTSFKVSSTVPTRVGFLFRGWALTSTAETADYDSNDTVTTDTATTTLYAVWASANLQVTLDCEGGVLENGSTTQIFYASYESTYGASADQTPIKSGYKFKGWSAYPWQFFPVNSKTMVWMDRPHTLYAWWEPESPLKRAIVYQM